MWRNNPYDLQFGYVVDDHQSSRSESPAGPLDQSCVTAETLHQELIGHVNFEPYPIFDVHAAPQLPFTKHDCVRLFVGQIPYDTPAKQVEWIVYVATGRRVYFSETIQRWTGARQPKGCSHTYCLPHDQEAIVGILHRRVLVDDSGIWVAADDAQHQVLEEYCARMKSDKTLRFRERPYQPVVVECATSDFVPRKHANSPPPPVQEVTMLPPQYGEFVNAQMLSQYT